MSEPVGSAIGDTMFYLRFCTNLNISTKLYIPISLYIYI